MDKIKEIERRIDKLEKHKRTKLLRPKDICEMLSIGLSSLYDIINNDEDFPNRIKFSKQSVGFREEEIERWIDLKTVAEDNYPLDNNCDKTTK